jgi:hypothetical protein
MKRKKADPLVHIWTYSSLNATLKKDGKFFAIVTPDGQNALSPESAVELVNTLTAGSSVLHLRHRD